MLCGDRVFSRKCLAAHVRPIEGVGRAVGWSGDMETPSDGGYHSHSCSKPRLCWTKKLKNSNWIGVKIPTIPIKIPTDTIKK